MSYHSTTLRTVYCNASEGSEDWSKRKEKEFLLNGESKWNTHQVECCPGIHKVPIARVRSGDHDHFLIWRDLGDKLPACDPKDEF